MAIFNRKYLLEKYVSKYADDVKDMDDNDQNEDNDIDDDEDDDQEDTEEKDEKKVEDKKPANDQQKKDVPNSSQKSNDQEQKPKSTNFLSKDEIDKCIVVVKTYIQNYPKIKKCCDYVDLSDRENINDEGEYESEYDRYYDAKPNGPIKIITGEVWGGYPNFRNGGSDDYDSDVDKFVKAVNDKIKDLKIPAKFSLSSEKDDETVEFSLRSTKGKE